MSTFSEELAWLKANPHFEQRPATLPEFLGPKYLNIQRLVRKSIERELTEIMGDQISSTRPTKYPYAMFTGAIGIGKTTVASIVLTYLAHWVLCLKNPQEFYDLLPGSRIAFMMMSTTETQAKEVLFGDIKARIKGSPWFQANFRPDPQFKNQIRFEAKDVWILPGDSVETTFEGYNILGGILDEADSHRVTLTKDYAENGFSTIDSRITSRFQARGFLMVIGQMKMSEGFAARTYEQFLERDDAYAVRMTIWDSMGREFYDKPENGDGKWFWYDSVRRQILPAGFAKIIANQQVFEVPELYRNQFEKDPVKALRDLAGVPPLVGDAFISMPDRITDCRDLWVARHGSESPYTIDGKFQPWFSCRTPLKRVAHIDIGFSAQGDALGFAMGHVLEMVEIDKEPKPRIVFDLLVRMQARPGSQIQLSAIRHVLYHLRDSLNFRFDLVTLDGFESTDMMQQLEKRRFRVDYLSVDKKKLPYEDLREAIYERRIEFPPYMVNVRRGEHEKEVEIAISELGSLVDTGKKIDHPAMGSKDVADCMAAVVYTLMGDRRYRRAVPQLGQHQSQPGHLVSAGGGGLEIRHPAYVGDRSIPRAPLPPRTWGPA